MTSENQRKPTGLIFFLNGFLALMLSGYTNGSTGSETISEELLTNWMSYSLLIVALVFAVAGCFRWRHNHRCRK